MSPVTRGQLLWSLMRGDGGDGGVSDDMGTSPMSGEGSMGMLMMIWGHH